MLPSAKWTSAVRVAAGSAAGGALEHRRQAGRRRGRRRRASCLSRRLPLRACAGVVHVDGLDLGEELDGGRALLARADARGLDAAEGQLGLAAGRAAVDVDDPGLDAVHEAEDAGHVAGEDRGGEAEAARRWRPSWPRRSPSPGSPRSRGRRSPPARCASSTFTWSKTVGSTKWPWASAPVLEPAAAADQRRPLLPADLDVARGRSRAGDWSTAGPMSTPALEPVADADLRRARGEPLHERVRDRLLDDHARGRRAALARGPERALGRGLHREVEVGVGQHHHRVLAAHLRLHADHPLGGPARRSRRPRRCCR